MAEIPVPTSPPPDIETGNTAFSVKHGKLQIRATWAFRGLTTILLLLCNVGVYFVTSSLKTVNEMKESLVGIHQELAVMRASTMDHEQNRRLDDLEQRVRDLERPRRTLP